MPVNKLYHHKCCHYFAIVRESNKSYMFRLSNGEALVDVWVAKSLCRNLNTAEQTVYIHKNTLASILENAGVPDDEPIEVWPPIDDSLGEPVEYFEEN